MAKKIIIENASIVNKNFRGLEKVWDGKVVNAEGKKNFSVRIEDPVEAQALIDDGWNVKAKMNADGDPVFFMPVHVNFGGWKPPIVEMYVGGTMNPLDEDTCSVIDHATIEMADVTINQGSRESNNGTFPAYLDTLRIKVVDDAAPEKWRELIDEPADESELPFN